jgi:hypothetical protein
MSFEIRRPPSRPVPPVTRIFIATGLSFRNSGWTAWRSNLLKDRRSRRRRLAELGRDVKQGRGMRRRPYEIGNLFDGLRETPLGWDELRKRLRDGGAQEPVATSVVVVKRWCGHLGDRADAMR